MYVISVILQTVPGYPDPMQLPGPFQEATCSTGPGTDSGSSGNQICTLNLIFQEQRLIKGFIQLYIYTL